MFYCSTCQMLCESECPSCGSKKLREVQANDPVLLVTANEIECGRVTALLEDSGIPYEKRIFGLEAAPNALFGDYGSSNKNIFVPYCELERSRELIGCTAELSDEEDINQDGGTIQENAPEAESEEKLSEEEDARHMSRGKRIFWRIISVALFILIVWAVVSGSDFLANWVKHLFTK